MDIPKKGQLWKHKNSGRKAWISTANDIRTYYRVSGAFAVDGAKTADFVAHYKNTGITDRLEIDGRTMAPTETPEQRQIRDEVDQRMNGHQTAQERQEGQPGDDHDPVNHPKHYTSDPSGVECIQVTRHRNFNIGNAIKYLWRNGLKDGNDSVQELRKAAWYINDEIERIEGKRK